MDTQHYEVALLGRASRRSSRCGSSTGSTRSAPSRARTRRLVVVVRHAVGDPRTDPRGRAVRRWSASQLEPQLTYQGASFQAFVVAAAVEEACKIFGGLLGRVAAARVRRAHGRHRLRQPRRPRLRARRERHVPARSAVAAGPARRVGRARTARGARPRDVDRHDRRDGGAPALRRQGPRPDRRLPARGRVPRRLRRARVRPAAAAPRGPRRARPRSCCSCRSRSPSLAFFVLRSMARTALRLDDAEAAHAPPRRSALPPASRAELG